MELLHDDSRKQSYPGVCYYCGYVIVDFTESERKKEDFKYCRGFGHYDHPGKVIILYECPKCFIKSHFHVQEKWIEFYKKWIEEVSIVLAQ